LPLPVVAPSSFSRMRAVAVSRTNAIAERLNACTCHCVVFASNEPARCHAAPSQASTEAIANPLLLRRAETLKDTLSSPSVDTSITIALPFCPDPVITSPRPATSPARAFRSVPASVPSPPVNSARLAVPPPASATRLGGTGPESALKFQFATTSARAAQAQSHRPAAPARATATPRFLRCIAFLL